MMLFVTLILGGASRPDVQINLLLRPLAAVLLVWAAVAHGRSAWRNHRGLMLFALAVCALPLAHLIPLPPAIWSALPGREIVTEIHRLAGIDGAWLPVAVVPGGAWNAVFALFLPLAVLIVAAAADDRQRFAALRMVIVVGLISGIIGLGQILGSPNGHLYFYDVTNNGSAVGVFANRNHQAVLLATLFPLLAWHVSVIPNDAGAGLRHRFAALAIAVCITPLILVTGSRNGLIIGIIALLLSLWIYDEGKGAGPRSPLRGAARPILVLGGLVALAIVTVGVSRGVAVQRLIELDPSQDLRARALPTIWQITLDHFPVGTGIGSFDEVYRRYEPTQLLSPNYLNHAHNDWLELLMTGGLPAALLAVVGTVLVLMAGVALARASKNQMGLRKQIVTGRCAIVLLVLLAIASLGEYPARTTALSTAAALCAVCVAVAWRGARHARRPGDRATSAGEQGLSG